MQKILDYIYKNKSLLYKGILYIVSIVTIVYFFPQGGKFKFEFQKGKPWQHETLYAPFDFSIDKSNEDVAEEQLRITNGKLKYFDFDLEIAAVVLSKYNTDFHIHFTSFDDEYKEELYKRGKQLLASIYTKGVLQSTEEYSKEHIYIIKNNEAKSYKIEELLRLNQLNSFLSKKLEGSQFQEHQEQYYNLFFELIKPNVFYNDAFSNKVIEEELLNISLTRGSVNKGTLVITRGEIVEGKKHEILNSLKKKYQSQLWSESNLYFIIFGYTVLVALVLIMLLLFLKKYREEIFNHNIKVTFIFFNIVLMVFITTLIVKYNASYVLVVPLCILPLIIKAFFDARLGLFVHVLAVLILGFVVPNSFEYIFLQIIGGIVTILTISEFYKRANLFISVGQITLVYCIGYFAFQIIHEGSFNNFQWIVLGLFALNGMMTLFAQPLIYIYEKLFGLVSDVSLLELSDTNSKLLKQLANKAPGTFHHSLQVANLAEAAASAIGANAMLVRVGALYHDIGKMNNPTYFTENQRSNVNPHDELTPKDSATTIINHVIEGIELARKNKLPDRIIDFIRTHHGTSMVYYFYKKEEGLIGDAVDQDDFRYPGPVPFSKETVILMMADSIEAASKSLKEPTFVIINDFVDRIISKQMDELQYQNANITFREIEIIKKVFKHKLINIYHLRVEYPE